jgi:octanoyl-[GcvH]:protein N-octanoyltransferase
MHFPIKETEKMKKNENSLLNQPIWRYIDHSNYGPAFLGLQSFAIDDTLCTTVGKGLSNPTIRSWVHENTIVLGIADTRLPYINEGVSYLERQGYQVIVRNSGGLAVVLDAGILNISLIFPNTEKGIDIDRGYDAMYQLIKDSLAEYQVDVIAKEIVGSYCPGSFDLSINGKKFAGISQRRIRNGVAVQIYLCVNGSGSERASLIQGFYETAKKNEETKTLYPNVDPKTMSSLSQCLGIEMHIPDMMVKLLTSLKKYNSHLVSSQLSTDEVDLYHENYERIVKRNEKALDKI